ncbi:MAG: cytochrome c oxidase subunit II [Acidobacteria bacterium]|nr:cytochrome c oxidase subunit II [Acidobacteriota bacterium]
MTEAEATWRRNRRLLMLLVLAAVLVVSACAGTDRLGLESVVSDDIPQNSLNPAGPEARQIDGLWWLVFWIATAVFVVVEAALIYMVVRFRQRKGEDRQVKQVHGNTKLEIIWTILPAVLLTVIAIPTVATLLDLRSAPDPSDNALQIEVIGHQWWWEFSYPEYGFTTANELHIPAGRLVYLTMTSADVIHSFWVPQLAGKRDLVPGRETNLKIEADEPGLFLGQCAEFCGLAHADMRLRVFASTEAEFETWALAQAQPANIPAAGPAADGWETFSAVCASCHTIDGTSAGARLAPNLTHFASRTTFGSASFALEEQHLRQWLADPSSLKPMRPELNDLEAGRVLGMPNLGLTEDQIDGLIALLETLE